MSLHPSVAARTGHENDRIRAYHSIVLAPLEEDSQHHGHIMDAPWTDLAECGFPAHYIDALRTLRFREPTPIQMQAWPTGLSGKNIIAVAPTGSGKTMAYVLPMLSHLSTQKKPGPGQGPLAVVLAPTKELIRQVSTVINGLIQLARTNISCEAFSSDEAFEKHAHKLQGVVEIVVATPGRWLSLLQRGAVDQKRTGFFVLDEADDLVDESRNIQSDKEGFLPQLQQIFQVSRPDRQVWLFSATWQTENIDNLKYICGQGTTVRIEVGGTKLMACKDVAQKFWCEGINNWQDSRLKKLDMLVLALQKAQCHGQNKAMVFCQGKNIQEVEIVLKQKGMKVEAYTEGILERFRVEGESPHILLCTDALQRGVDLPLVRIVVNYDMPRNLTAYVHRVGRTGRHGTKGFAMTLMEEADFRQARQLCEMMQDLGQPSANLVEAERRDRTARRFRVQQPSSQQLQQPQQSLTEQRRPTNGRASLLKECRRLATC